MDRAQGWIEQRMLARWFPNSPPSESTSKRANAWPERQIEKHLARKRSECLKLNRGQIPPVVVIGNLVVGGGGKTPLIVELCKELQAQQLNVAIICSGYGAQLDEARLVNAKDDAKLNGDEAVLLAQLTGCPVIAGKQRQLAYEWAVSKFKPDIVLCDDGLQHFSLERAVQIVCVDERGFGNQRLLPFGPLREPLDTLASVDGIVVSEQSETFVRHLMTQLNATDVPVWPSRLEVSGLRAMGGLKEIESREIESREIESSEGRGLLSAAQWVNSISRNASPVHLIAGIANPERFFSLMRQLFPTIAFETHALRDHAAINNSLFQRIQGQTVVMTEKDAVKWRQYPLAAQTNWFALNIEKKSHPGLTQFIRSQLL